MLLKGGHLAGDQAVDFLCTNGGVVEFSAPFVRGVHTHGTGCTYSAAIAAGLASGLPLEESDSPRKTVRDRGDRAAFQPGTRNGASVHALNHSPNETI